MAFRIEILMNKNLRVMELTIGNTPKKQNYVLYVILIRQIITQPHFFWHPV